MRKSFAPLLLFTALSAFAEPYRVLVMDNGFDPKVLDKFYSKEVEFKADADLSKQRYQERSKQIRSYNPKTTSEMLTVQNEIISSTHGTNVSKELTENLSPADLEIVPLDVLPFFKDQATNIIPPEKALMLAKDTIARIEKALQSKKLDSVIIAFSYPPTQKEARDFFSSGIKKLIAQFPSVHFAFAAGNKGECLDSNTCNPNTSAYMWIGEKELPPNVTLVGSCICNVPKRSEFSNFGINVKVYTSGEQVKYVLPEGFESIGDEHGTSFSTPRFLNEVIKRHSPNTKKVPILQAISNSIKDRKKSIDPTPIFTHDDLPKEMTEK